LQLEVEVIIGGRRRDGGRLVGNADVFHAQLEDLDFYVDIGEVVNVVDRLTLARVLIQGYPEAVMTN